MPIRFATLPVVSFARVWQRAADPPLVFVFPMDQDMRSNGPGGCSQCGLAMVPVIRDDVESPVDIRLATSAEKPARGLRVEFAIRSPNTGGPVLDFPDAPPAKGPGGVFRFEGGLPVPGSPISGRTGMPQPEAGPRRAANLIATLRGGPQQPVAGQKTPRFFTLDSGDGPDLDPGAQGHLMAVCGSGGGAWSEAAFDVPVAELT